ncbi:MAG: FtsX-like permease family protein [Cytophagales bacterium]|nr:MAG: FtsX-like permease family protein [Cytophagales bacterium]
MWHTAYRFLTYDKSKLFGILAGIIMSVVLIGQQLGIFNNMTESVRGLAFKYPDYVWVISLKTQSVTQLQAIDVRVGRQLQSIPGVQRVYPLVLASGSAKSARGSKSGLPFQLVGVQTPDFVGGATQYVSGTNLADLMNEGAVIIDKSALPTMDNIRVGEFFTINDQRVYVSGLSVGMTGFGSTYGITTLERARKLSGQSTNYVNAYLVAVDTTQASQQAVIEQIKTNIGQVRAVVGRKFGGETLSFMLATSNIAVSFGMMVAFALVAGFVIVGLTLYSSVNDRLRDYGTIKAIGGSNSLIRRLILTQAVLYAIVGFGIGFGLLELIRRAMAGGQMSIYYPGWLIAALIGITLLISVVSSLIALRRITRLEPVQIFRM